MPLPKKTLIARQLNPTPELDGRSIEPMGDDIGRQVMVLHQVRDLIVTAFVQITNGTPTVLKAGNSGYFLDLVEISFATNSTVAATNVALRDDGTTVRGVDIPVDDTVQLEFSVPIPQNAKGGDWVVDMEDVTGTTLDIAATFIKNV